MAIAIDQNGYLRSRNGIVQAVIVGLSFLGGLINIFSGSGFTGFLFWSTFSISGSLLLLNVFGAYAAINAKFGFFFKVEFGYTALWALLYLIAAIVSFIPSFWYISNIVVYFVVIAFGVDLFFRYRIYRGVPAGGPANPPETVEQA